MSADPTAALFKAVRAKLISDAEIVAAVGHRISSSWSAQLEAPFIRIDAPRTRPYDDDCGEGAETRLRVHVWSKDGEIDCALIAGRVRTVLNNSTFPVDGHDLDEITYEGTDYRPDSADPTLSKGVATFNVITAAI